MPELRTPDSDRPDDRPAETRDQLDAGRIKELNALADSKAFDPRTPPYNPLDHVRPRGSREDAAETGGAERPGLLGLRDRVRAESEDRFPRSDAEKLATGVDRPEPDPEDRGPEVLHAFGNKERPRPPRLDNDLKLESWDQVIGPFAPKSPTDEGVLGASTFIDPFHPDVKLSRHYHRLPPDFQPPEGSGLAIHADGRDVDQLAPHGWGHRTIYPTEAMTAAEFAQRVADLPWEYAGNKKKGHSGHGIRPQLDQ